jgi:hypothetical protein
MPTAMLALAASSLASLAFTAVTAQRALADALSRPGARVEVLGLRNVTPGACTPRSWSSPKAVGSSGPVAMRFDGQQGEARCQGWAWADVKVFATGLRLTRDVQPGEALAGAVEAAEIEVTRGRRTLFALPDGAAASRAMRAGTLLAGSDLRVGPAPGDPVTVRVRAGALELTLPARAVACARATCAILPGGRRVEGRWDGTHLALEAP